jgi:hypothetical protein
VAKSGSETGEVRCDVVVTHHRVVNWCLSLCRVSVCGC